MKRVTSTASLVASGLSTPIPPGVLKVFLLYLFCILLSLSPLLFVASASNFKRHWTENFIHLAAWHMRVGLLLCVVERAMTSVFPKVRYVGGGVVCH